MILVKTVYSEIYLIKNKMNTWTLYIK